MLFIATIAELADTLGPCQSTAYSPWNNCVIGNQYLLEVLADWLGDISTICTVSTVEFGHSRRRGRASGRLAVK